MKKTVAWMLTFILLLGSFSSCKSKKDGKDISSAEEDASLIRCQKNKLIYQNMLFYSYKNENSYTLQYQNFGNIKEQGLPLYGDVLAEEDPFEVEGTASYLMAVDKKATRDNGDMPVLIIEYPYVQEFVQTEDGQIELLKYYGIFSFNTATNQLTMLVGELEAETEFSLYNDRIYFARYLPIEGTEDQYGTFPYTITTEGKDLKQYAFPDDLGCKLLAESNGNLYWVQSRPGLLYRCDADFENFEKVMDNIPTYVNTGYPLNTTDPFICDDYIYYSSGFDTAEIDGVKVEYHDIVKKSLTDPDAKEETVLEDIYCPLDGWYNTDFPLYEKHFYYYRLDEVKITDYATSKKSTAKRKSSVILHDLSLETGEDSIVFDYSDIQHENVPMLYYITKNHCIVDTRTNGYLVIDRKTGSETVLPEL